MPRLGSILKYRAKLCSSAIPIKVEKRDKIDSSLFLRDSNPNQQNQNLLCYRYTKEQAIIHMNQRIKESNVVTLKGFEPLSRSLWIFAATSTTRFSIYPLTYRNSNLCGKTTQTWKQPFFRMREMYSHRHRQYVFATRDGRSKISSGTQAPILSSWFLLLFELRFTQLIGKHIVCTDAGTFHAFELFMNSPI